jgi:hypothetical protein
MKINSTLAVALFCIALIPIAAKADDNQQACMSDAMTVCSQFIPDRQRVASCLISNRSRVSAPCRTALAHWHS